MKRAALSALVLVVVVSMVGLPANQPTHAQTERLTVVATYSILGDVIAQVAGDAADVDILMPLNADPHSYSPSGSDIALLEEANVVFSNGVGFEGGLADILNNGDINHVVASMCVPIWDFEATYGGHDHEGEEHADEVATEDAEHEGEEHEGEEHEHDAAYEALEVMCETHFGEIAAVRGETPAYWEGTLGPLYSLECGGHSHEEGEEHEGEEHEGEEHAEGEEGEEAHDHGNCDPHVWLDPYTGWLWALMARDTLTALDPANAEVYAANAAAFVAELSPAIDEINALYDSIPADQRVLIANHRVMGYIANPFGFEAVFAVIPGGSTTAEPSAQDIVELIEVIEDEGVRAIFSEVTIADNVVSRIADETGAAVVTLYTESLSEADGPAATYIDMLRFNATAISDGLAE